MFNRIRSVIAHALVRNSVKLQIGSVGAMLVQAGANVLLARLLGPHEFGRYAIAMSMAAVGSVLLGAGAADAMAPVLTRAHHGGDDRGVRDAALFLGKFVLASACMVLLLGLLMPAVADRLYHDRMVGWYGLAVLAAATVSTLLLVPTQLLLQVFDKIGRLSLLTLADQFTRQVVVLSLAFAGLGVLGAAYGNLFGAFIVFVIAAFFWRTLRRKWSIMPSVRELFHTFPGDGKRYVRPTLWVLADRNLAMLFSAAPVAISALFLTASDVSFFKISVGWIGLVLGVLSPVGTLLNTELARIQIQKPTQLRAHFVRISLVGTGISALLTLIAALIAGPVVRLLYGVAYEGAVPLVYWLIPFGIQYGFGIALGAMWRAIDRVRISIVINILTLLVVTPFGIIALQTWGAVGAVALMTGWYVVSHGASFIYLLRLLRSSSRMGSTL